jgi:hypothetical protein
MSLKNVRSIVLPGLLVFSLLILSACETFEKVNSVESSKLICAICTIINDPEYVFNDYIIDEICSESKWTIQFIDGQGEFIERTESYTRYYHDGEAIILENGSEREDLDFSFDSFKDDAQAVFDTIRAILLTYDTDHFRIQRWKGFFSGGSETVLYCSLMPDDIVLLHLDSAYDKADVIILFIDDQYLYLTLSACSSNSNNTIKYIIGEINYRLALEIPEK